MKLSIKDDTIYLDEGKMEIFTPQDYIGTVATINGDILKTFGAAVYKYYKNPKDKKPSKVGTLMLPSFLNFFPTYIDQNVKDTIWDGVYDEVLSQLLLPASMRALSPWLSVCVCMLSGV